MDDRTRRTIRQLLEIDRLMGADAVPVSDRVAAVAAASVQTAPPPPPPRPESEAPFALKRSTPTFPPPARPTTPMARRTTTPGSAPAPAAAMKLPPIAPNTLDAPQKAAALAALAQEHGSQCPHCLPQLPRLNVVFGEGHPAAALMFVGEGPGEEEDRAGRPFVGRSGQLLDKQIAAMGLRREDVYIANIVKTRPPNNRVPTPDEAQRCMPYLARQIEIIQPKAIVALGATAAKYLLANPALAITRERGQWKDYRGIKVMPTFHPAYLLRAYTAENRGRVWDDLRKVMELLGLPMPPK